MNYFTNTIPNLWWNKCQHQLKDTGTLSSVIPSQSCLQMTFLQQINAPSYFTIIKTTVMGRGFSSATVPVWQVQLNWVWSLVSINQNNSCAWITPIIPTLGSWGMNITNSNPAWETHTLYSYMIYGGQLSTWARTASWMESIWFWAWTTHCREDKKENRRERSRLIFLERVSSCLLLLKGALALALGRVPQLWKHSWASLPFQPAGANSWLLAPPSALCPSGAGAQGSLHHLMQPQMGLCSGLQTIGRILRISSSTESFCALLHSTQWAATVGWSWAFLRPTLNPIQSTCSLLRNLGPVL